MAGGTGGHVFPALAVADELKQRDVAISWIGTARGIEARLVPEAGYTLSEIKVQGLRGNGALGWLMAPFRVVKAIWEAAVVIRQTKPDVVIGLGGFASGPGGVAAWCLGKPIVIHEQNAIPGLTNKLLAKVAKHVLTGFPNVFGEKAKSEWVGNPVRKEIEDLPMPHLRQNLSTASLNLLILGGSLGARSLNIHIPAALGMIEQRLRPTVRHQCGTKHLEQCRDAYQQAGVEAQVTDFIGDMAEAYAWADLVICRSGALTVAELAAAGVASILVPYPYAVDDHQTHNAALLVDAGGAELIADSELSVSVMADKIKYFVENKDTLLSMANAARQAAKIGSASHIADICMELAHG